jgi:hypothetical protein
VVPCAVAAAIAMMALVARDAAAAKPARASSRRANPRTGRLAPALAELVKAAKRGDRAALGRVADRLGPARLAEAVTGSEPGVSEAALAAAPLSRGGVRLVGSVAAELWAAEPARATAAAVALGTMLDGASPNELEEWEVPPDAVGRACGGLKAVALRAGAAPALRLAALDAIASTLVTCGSPADLAPLAHDPSGPIRRAAVLVMAMGERREAVLRDAIADGDKTVSAAGTAAACRVEGRTGRSGRPEPPIPSALASARTLASAPTTPVEDAVEMLDCLAAAGTPADRALLDELQRRPPSPLRDRAVELGGMR